MNATANTGNGQPSGAASGPDKAILPPMLRLFGMIPLSVSRAVGSLIGVVSWLASPGYRRKIDKNLAIAGYGPGPIRRQAILEAGRMIAECPYIWAHTPREISRQILLNYTPEDAQSMREAEQRGKGVLILTPHLGSFEVAARYYAARRPITVLFKPPKLEFAHRWLLAARAVKGIEAVPPTVGGLRTMLRTLRRGDIVGLLPDQVPTEGDGEWARFFGQPAYTMTLPQRLVEMTGCAVVLCVGERLTGGRGWRMHFEPLNEVPTPTVINARFETLIRKFPGQYLWGYNRYKRPPGVSEASDPDSALRDPHSPVAAPPANTVQLAMAEPPEPATLTPNLPDIAR